MSASFYSADDLAALWISLKLAIVTAIALLLLCTPLAWWLAMTRSRLRVIGEAMAALPLVSALASAPNAASRRVIASYWSFASARNG